jgi:hypothetical protein
MRANEEKENAIGLRHVQSELERRGSSLAAFLWRDLRVCSGLENTVEYQLNRLSKRKLDDT